MKITDIFKKNHYTYAFWLTLTLSIGLMVGSFFCPPMGAIDGSVLTAVGELFLFPSLALFAKSLSEGKKASFKKGELEVEIGKGEETNED